MRLIDADRLIARLQKDPLFGLIEPYGIIGVIEAEPAVDAVPVVRCKDCIYWEKDRECWCAGSKQYYCYFNDICTDENFYCGGGSAQTYLEKYRNKIKLSSIYGEMKEDAKR